MGSIRVAAVMAVHNRRELTLSCLDSLLAQRAPGVSLDIFVLDDDSTDGTAEAIARHHPERPVASRRWPVVLERRHAARPRRSHGW